MLGVFQAGEKLRASREVVGDILKSLKTHHPAEAVDASAPTANPPSAVTRKTAT
jgi:hypothetical protein